MSGPIVRKYGFPNHESIFGKRDLGHGVEEGASTETPAAEGAKAEAAAPAAEKKSKAAKTKKKAGG